MKYIIFDFILDLYWTAGAKDLASMTRDKSLAWTGTKEEAVEQLNKIEGLDFLEVRPLEEGDENKG